MSDGAAAAVAIALYAFGGAVGVVWRSWRQLRRTGSTGLRLVGARVGSAEWFGGLGLAMAVCVTLAAPVSQLLGVLAPLPFLNTRWIQAAGIAVAVIGISAVLYAQLAMGDSWRIGVDRSETTNLVRSGVFGVVRNPIYLAMFVFWLGVTLVAPNIVALIGYLLLVAAIELQVRCVEEPYLLRVHGDAYREYGRRVGRFAPRVGLIRCQTSP
jgi:protein-S-isoprenylcysteine O-methyltransferase Ste14